MLHFQFAKQVRNKANVSDITVERKGQGVHGAREMTTQSKDAKPGAWCTCFSSHLQFVGLRNKGHTNELKIALVLGTGVEHELKYLNRSLKVLLTQGILLPTAPHVLWISQYFGIIISVSQLRFLTEVCSDQDNCRCAFQAHKYI